MSDNNITDVNIAKAVLTTAKEHSVWESSIPSDEKKLLVDANFVYEQAEAAWKNGMRGKAVTAVKFSAEVDGKVVLPEVDDVLEDESDVPARAEVIVMGSVGEIKERIEKLSAEGDLELVEAIYHAEKEGKARRTLLKFIDEALKDAYKEPDESGEIESGDRGEAQGSGPVSPWANDEDASKPSRFDETFEAEEFARAQAKKMNLPVPGRIDDIPNPTLSHGVANLTIGDLGEKLNDASLCLAAATWQTALAEIDLEHAKRVGNHYFNKEFPRAQKDAKNKDAATAMVEEIEKVATWRQKEFEAESRYTTYRSLKEIYSGTHGTISRIFAMKQEERERG